jgi:hypothetical protein
MLDESEQEAFFADAQREDPDSEDFVAQGPVMGLGVNFLVDKDKTKGIIDLINIMPLPELLRRTSKCVRGAANHTRLRSKAIEVEEQLLSLVNTQLLVANKTVTDTRNQRDAFEQSVRSVRTQRNAQQAQEEPRRAPPRANERDFVVEDPSDGQTDNQSTQNGRFGYIPANAPGNHAGENRQHQNYSFNQQNFNPSPPPGTQRGQINMNMPMEQGAEFGRQNAQQQARGNEVNRNLEQMTHQSQQNNRVNQMEFEDRSRSADRDNRRRI